MDYEDFKQPVLDVLNGVTPERARYAVAAIDPNGHLDFSEGERLEDKLWYFEQALHTMWCQLSYFECILSSEGSFSVREFSDSEMEAAISDLVKVLELGARDRFIKQCNEARARIEDDYSYAV